MSPLVSEANSSQSVSHGSVELPTQRVGSLEGPCAPAKRRMPLMRLPGARIAALTSSDADWRFINTLLAHELDSLVRFRAVDELVQGERPDIVILDRAMLCDGALALRRIRQRWLTCTVIVTGAADRHDAGQLLDIGADDAIAIDDQLLASRLRAAARRARSVNTVNRIAIGDILFDRESHGVWCANSEVHLTRTEEALLDCLFWYAPRPASVAELTSFAWGRTGCAERPNLVHVYVGYLRRKLSGSRQVAIRTVRGVGYDFAARA